jgi:putative flippase GtrA
MREIAIKIKRFTASGLIVTGLHGLTAAGIINYVINSPPIANGIAFILATFISYLLNTLWSFSSQLSKVNLLRFILVSFLGFTLAVSVSAIADHYALHYIIGIGLVVCTVTPATFLLHTFWTYQKSSRSSFL